MIPTRNMKLHNFEICSSIEFQSGGLFWDVHNLASFDGLELIRAGNVAVMRWSVPSAASNPWGGLGIGLSVWSCISKTWSFYSLAPAVKKCQ
jgi:hypothetical protein